MKKYVHSRSPKTVAELIWLINQYVAELNMNPDQAEALWTEKIRDQAVQEARQVFFWSFKLLSKIEILVKNRNFSRKSKF